MRPSCRASPFTRIWVIGERSSWETFAAKSAFSRAISSSRATIRPESTAPAAMSVSAALIKTRRSLRCRAWLRLMSPLSDGAMRIDQPGSQGAKDRRAKAPSSRRSSGPVKSTVIDGSAREVRSATSASFLLISMRSSAKA
jgi:hypothetical protein